MDNTINEYSAEQKMKYLLDISEEFNQLKDIDSLLDKILLEARRFSAAEAGSIYLVDGKSLIFSYIQNETLFKKPSDVSKYLYSNQKVKINKNSIAGYVASTRKPLNIIDAYNLDKSLPFSFNDSFDKSNNYHTHSILTLPLKTSQNILIGVLQVINKKKDNQLLPFSESDVLYVSHFANNAAVAIERAKMTREIILRMIKLTELHDPKETGAHVNRVGSYAIELYQHWANKKNLSENEIKVFKDNLRIAAMLHDIGKVAISDIILKKPAKLTNDEFETMKLHTVLGARVFVNQTSELDKMSQEISLNHHEKWDGTGYPGYIKDLYAEKITFGKGKRKYEIPLAARLTAVADVYDALASRRSYKSEWATDKIYNFFEAQAGHHFDPDIVESLFDIKDVMEAIHNKFN